MVKTTCCCKCKRCSAPVNKKTPLWRNVDCVRGGGGGGGGERRGRNILVPGGLSLFITCLAGEEEEIH